MHLEDLEAALDIRGVHLDLPVEAARTDEGLVQNVGTVGGSKNNHAVVALEAIHLSQELVHLPTTAMS